jgi:Fe-S cluster biogenesis protein NfuA
VLREPVVRQLVESMAPAVRADGGDLQIRHLEDGVLTLNYRQPADCDEGACSMPPGRIQQMLEAMFRAQGDPKLKVVVEID